MRMMSGDLEDGEIEDGEIPEEAGTQVVNASPEEKPQVRITPSPDVVAKQSESATKSETLLVKAKRTSGVTNQRHSGKEDVKGSGLEDDWAGVVEKAIQAALGGKEKGHELPSGAGNEEDGGERNVRWNKRRKKHQGDEDRSKDPKKMKWSHGIPAEEAMETGQVGSSGGDDDYDDEMLFVRGASPVMPGNYGSSPHGFHDESGSYKEGGQFEELYDSDYDPDEYMREDCGHKRGGRGGKPRLLGRGGGRGMMKKRPIGLKKPIGSLGKRLLNKRQQQRMGKPPQGSQQASESICAFFMQGKCQKENECPYSHNALPPRKMELCKFYLMGCCAKKDKCLYMHSDFPCKFFHSGLKCAAGNRCKFSHGNLTESLKDVLLKHLETAPKEILGDFPRERAATMIYNKNCGNKGPWPVVKKIPSLLEIEVPIPPQLLAGNPELRRDDEKPGGRHSVSMINSENEVADKDGCRGVMKSSSPKMAGRGNIRQWDGDDGARPGDSGEEDIRHKGFHKMFRGRMMPNREPSEEREMPRRLNYQDQDFSEQLQQLKMLFKKEIKNSGENADAEGNTETQHQQRKHHRHGKKRKKKSRDEDQPRSKKSAIIAAVYSDENMEPAELDNKTSDAEGAELTDEEGKLEIDVQQEDEAVEDEEEKGSSPSRADNSAVNFQDLKDDIVNADKEQGETDNNSSNCSLEMAGLPHNLPKKQRELFLRIQQQQREAADLNSQDKSGKEDDKEMDEDQQEESWYSSDEEETSLADVLKNLSKQETSNFQQQEQQKPPSPSRTPPLPPPGNTSTLLDGIKLSDINISEPISKLLSIIQQTTIASNVGHTVETSESRSTAQSHMPKESTVHVRDPRLASAEAHRRSANVNSMSPNAHENPRQDPRISKRANSRNQGHRTSIYSSTVVPSGSVMQDPGESASDVDMKNMHISQSNPSFELGTNVDPRTNRASSSTSSPYALGDLDLAGSVDMKGSLGLPFKPVPMHKPATEIDASLTSHPPIQYKVIPITIPWPDYSRLKLNVSDVQIRNDPRLRKLFKMSGNSSKRQSSPPPPPPPSSPPPVPKQSPSNIARNDPRRRSAPMSPHSSMSPRIQETPPVYPDMMSHNPMGPPQNPMGIAQNPMGIAQNPMGPGQNPMGLMHNPNMPSGMVPGMSSGLNFDPRLPRNPRNAPGLLGPAPLPYNYCPGTPKCDDMEDGNGPNPDHRMFYNQPPMDMQQHQPRNQGMHRNRTWKNNRKNQRRFRPHQQERSFTPPI